MTQLYASTSNIKKAKSSKFDFLLDFEKAAEFQRLFCFGLTGHGIGTPISNVLRKKAQLFLGCSPDQHHEMLAKQPIF
jgi:hypothetical protein